MRFFFNVVVFLFFFVSIAAAQELTREQKLQKIDELNNQIKKLENDVIAPSAKDLKQAQKEGFNAARIIPRESEAEKPNLLTKACVWDFASRYFFLKFYLYVTLIYLRSPPSKVSAARFLSPSGEFPLN